MTMRKPPIPTPRQRRFLANLLADGPIVDHPPLAFDQSTTVLRCIERGWIERRPISPNDGQTIFKLTRQGKKFAAKESAR